MMRGVLACLLALLMTAGLVRAQTTGDAAVLIADSVVITPDGRLVAEGSVEALFQDKRLRASRITYDQTTGRLFIDGPIRLNDGDQNFIIAQTAELDSELRNGLLRGARMVLAQQVQMASDTVERIEGRYTRLGRTAVTSCRICENGKPPLWQIRARSAVHDEVEKQLYFEDAQLRVAGVPVLYWPYLRLPDPTLDRATGFLVPSATSSSLLGLGVKLPYFIRIGDHADLTVTPYLTTESRTLQMRYRQVFRNGRIRFNGALSQDSLLPDEWRGYLFGSGAFDLPNDFKLTFDLETVTDEAYLPDYDFSDKDRLDSDLTLTRTDRDQWFGASLLHYQSLRDSETNATQPTIVADVLYERRFYPKAIGGEARVQLASHSHYRYSDDDVDGRDVSRASADMNWRRDWTLTGGLRAAATGQLWLDLFDVDQDSTSDSYASTATPAAAIELRYPMKRVMPSGAAHLIEPLAQIAYLGSTNADLPNDESTRVEFDEANLISLTRFPAPDRREEGLSAALGARWVRYDPAGWSAGLTLGKVIQSEENDAFTITSGLDGNRSDWLVAGQIANLGGLSLAGRMLFDDGADFSKIEGRAAWISKAFGMSASYVFLPEDAQEDRDDPVAEWTLDGRYRMSRHWTSSARWRYDLADQRTSRAGIGLEYRNECVEVDLSVSRRFTSSSTVEPSTNFGLTVGLKGFSTGRAANDFRRTCRN